LDEVRPDVEDKVKSPLGKTNTPQKEEVPVDAESKDDEEPVVENEVELEKIRDTKVEEKVVEPTTKEHDEAKTQAEDSTARLQETISLLIAERSDLQEQLAKLKTSLSAAEADSKLLAEGRDLITKLEAEKTDLESRLSQAEGESRRAAELDTKVSELERSVQDLRYERDKTKKEAEEGEEERRKQVEEGKERVEELEKGLSRAREREGGLEAEVGRLRSVSLVTLTTSTPPS
jgi:DNA repair exonuclease SbcCD ATPase subunit